jgi:hypothetical protein
VEPTGKELEEAILFHFEKVYFSNSGPTSKTSPLSPRHRQPPRSHLRKRVKGVGGGRGHTRRIGHLCVMSHSPASASITLSLLLVSPSPVVCTLPPGVRHSGLFLEKLFRSAANFDRILTKSFQFEGATGEGGQDRFLGLLKL